MIVYRSRFLSINSSPIFFNPAIITPPTPTHRFALTNALSASSLTLRRAPSVTYQLLVCVVLWIAYVWTQRRYLYKCLKVVLSICISLFMDQHCVCKRFWPFPFFWCSDFMKYLLFRSLVCYVINNLLCLYLIKYIYFYC